VGLSVGASAFSGTIPSEWGRLENLIYLELEQNHFSRNPIPSSIWMMRNMEYLHLGSNRFTGHIATEVGFLTNLKLLDLADNSLSGSLPSELGRLTDLHDFYFFANDLRGVVPKEVCHLLEDGLENFGAHNGIGCHQLMGAGLECPSEGCCPCAHVHV